MTTRRILTAEEIFAAGKPKRQFVQIPEWIGDNGDIGGVYIVQLGAVEYEQWQSETRDNFGKPLFGKVYTSALLRAAQDEDGKPVFTKEMLERLNTTAGQTLARLYAVFERLNGLPTDEEVDELVKN